jgi:hypothetical protein
MRTEDEEFEDEDEGDQDEGYEERGYDRQRKYKDEYFEKKQMIELEKQNAINFDNAKQSADLARRKVKTELNSFLSVMKDNLTPEFLIRMRFKKDFPAKIAASEE